MDRLDLQSARAVEHRREKLARALAGPRIIGLAEMQQIGPKLAVLEAHPGSKPHADAIRHLGSRCLRAGQAKDRLRSRALEQQPQHAGRQNLSLAAACRSRKRRMHDGIGSKRLLAFEFWQGLEAGAHAAFQASLEAIDVSA